MSKKQRPDWQPRFIDPLVKLTWEAKRPIDGAELGRWVREAERQVRDPIEPIGDAAQIVAVGGLRALGRKLSYL